MTRRPDKKRERKLSPEEEGLWRELVRDARPLRRSGRSAPLTQPSAKAAKAPAERDAPPSAGKPRAPREPPQPLKMPRSAKDPVAGLDSATQRKLARGELPIEARLDLHGLTLDEAHGALRKFLARAHGAGLRCIIIVTGKGRAGQGAIKSAVPRWLEEAPNRALVLAAAPARPQHGGEGALYLLLRRKREAKP